MASEKIATQNTIATRPDAAAIEPAARDSITLADLPNNSRLSVVTDRQEVTAPTPRAERNLSQNISGQIAQVVGRADAARTEIRLDPPELGRVTVTLQADGDSISAQISSERPEIAEMLRRHNDMLHRELTNAGFRNVSLDFGQPGQGDGGFERPSGPQAGESDVQPGPDDKDSARERSADAAASGLDLRV
ncbi:MAG: flagellar hook-length control protein FliK [Pseudomonadota bacterium]